MIGNKNKIETLSKDMISLMKHPYFKNSFTSTEMDMFNNVTSIPCTSHQLLWLKKLQVHLSQQLHKLNWTTITSNSNCFPVHINTNFKLTANRKTLYIELCKNITLGKFTTTIVEMDFILEIGTTTTTNVVLDDPKLHVCINVINCNGLYIPTLAISNLNTDKITLKEKEKILAISLDIAPDFFLIPTPREYFEKNNGFR